MRYPESFTLALHLLAAGRQQGEPRHMCPECGNPSNPFCVVCLGAGDISADRLDRWHAEQWRGRTV